MKLISVKATVVAMLPAMIMLALFYSLGVHMYWSLGRWPNYIGDQGFSTALVFHDNAASWWAGAMVVTSVFLWTPAVVVCAAVPKAQRLLPYLVIFAVSAIASYCLMQLAPKPFLGWWED